MGRDAVYITPRGDSRPAPATTGRGIESFTRISVLMTCEVGATVGMKITRPSIPSWAELAGFWEKGRGRRALGKRARATWEHFQLGAAKVGDPNARATAQERDDSSVRPDRANQGNWSSTIGEGY